MTIPLALCVQLAIAAGVGASLIAACRWLRRRSPLCAQVVVAGVLLRAAVMLILFWTSYLNLPVLRTLHSGDGFWKLAIDAPVYYKGAVKAAAEGLDTVARGSASPAFVKTLAVWMRATGSSPLNGAYLNLVLYVLVCLIVVAAFKPAGAWRKDLPCAVMLGAVSFSPVLVISDSQPLKDTMFVCLIGVMCVAARGLLPSLTLTGGEPRGSIARGLALAATFLAALYMIAGIRAYYVVIAWSALAVVLFACAWRQRGARLVQSASFSLLLLTSAWFAYMAGADLDYINPYRTILTRVPSVQSAVPIVAEIDQRREGFLRTPGATNVSPQTVPASPTPMEPGVGSPRVQAGGARGRLSAVAVGLGLIFVPVSVLKSLSVVDFPGGRGLLAITDVDTLFMDLTVIAIIAIVARNRSAIRGQWPYVCFAALLAAAAALLMAYIVTNFGTLFRLRVMAVAPLWMLPLALSNWIPQRDRGDDLAARHNDRFDGWIAEGIEPARQDLCAG